MGTMHISMRMKSIIPRPRVVDCRIKCEFLLVFCFFCAIWCMCHSSSSSSSSFLIIPLIQRMAKLLTSCRKIGSPPIAKTGFKCGNESIMWTWHPSIFVGIVYPSTYLDICSSIIWDSQGIWAYSWRGILVISRPICKSSLFICAEVENIYRWRSFTHPFISISSHSLKQPHTRTSSTKSSKNKQLRPSL